VLKAWHEVARCGKGVACCGKVWHEVA
jgi:hypothetical protein